MQVVFAFLAVFLVSANAMEDKDVLELWTKFQEDFGKSYRSPLEARKRFAIFQDNLNFIEAHNQLFESGQSTFSMGINQFADWSRSEFSSYVNQGLVKERQTLRNGKVFVPSENFVEPDSVDWRNKGVVTPVKDQQACGACWAFSTTGSLEGQYALKTGELVSLSEQNLVDCSKNNYNVGCNGGFTTSAFEYVKIHGINSEEDYPYENSEGKCRADDQKTITKIVDYVHIPVGNEKALVEAITTIGPVSVAVDASDDFGFYANGIFDGNCTTTELNHEILAVGFGSENGKQFYIVKNSWGNSWGEQGYIRLPRNSNNKCGVTTDSSFPII
ncbi:hypothetical protein WA026_006582 [Henosepilachna vigintioctopunctata]|uniref:Uncharacterized protein n=1 Tax=Henosepilachna vigintioctopunctata TaxID=420089 RepID=A0AAW1UH33_9CUCU